MKPSFMLLLIIDLQLPPRRRWWIQGSDVKPVAVDQFSHYAETYSVKQCLFDSEHSSSKKNHIYSCKNKTENNVIKNNIR